MKRNVIYKLIKTLQDRHLLKDARWDDEKKILTIRIQKEDIQVIKEIKIFSREEQFFLNRFPYITIKIRPFGKNAGGWIWLGHYIPFVPDFKYYEIRVPDDDAIFIMEKIPENSKFPRESIQAWMKFFSQIPRDVLYIPVNLTNKPWRLWQMVNKNPVAGRQLLHSNPQLAFLLSDIPYILYKKKISHPWRVVHRLLRSRRTEILRYLGLPAEKAFERILRKTRWQLIRLEGNFLEKLVDYYKNYPHMKKLFCHLDYISTELFNLFAISARYPYFFHPDLYKVLTEQALEWKADYLFRVDYLAREIINLHEFMGTQPGKTLFRNGEDMLRYHDKLVARLRKFYRQNKNKLKEYNFPPPPFPGIKIENIIDIQPVTGLAELYEESQVMKNCVISWFKRITKREVYIYRMLYPERATVGISQGRDGKWEVIEIRSYKNAPVKESTEQLAERWLEGEWEGERFIAASVE